MLPRLNRLFTESRRHLRTHALVRGMMTYSVTWPVGSLIQQTFDSKEYDLSRAAKFGLFGSLYVAPTLYGWMKLSCVIWPKPIIVHSIIKVSFDCNICYICTLF